MMNRFVKMCLIFVGLLAAVAAAIGVLCFGVYISMLFPNFRLYVELIATLLPLILVAYLWAYHG